MTPLTKANLGLWWFGWRYIPLIGFCTPRIRRMTSTSLAISMPHSWRTKNHLGSIYFAGSGDWR